MTPTEKQLQAIEHFDGPLFLSAGPGSGKTRVILWRVMNLIVFKKIDPSEVFLATFTEKAAKQLKDGLEDLLGMVTNITGKPYDISQMALGTVHSICRKLISDRRITGGERKKAPKLFDELDQYFFISKSKNWQEMIECAGFKSTEEAHLMINKSLGDARSKKSPSKHKAVVSITSFFNRLSEEHANPLKINIDVEIEDFEFVDNEQYDEEYKKDSVAFDNLVISRVLVMYDFYRSKLKNEGCTDFSLLQSEFYDILSASEDGYKAFKYIIVDEYQDTNSIQEKIYFELARGYKNIAVVGDDDQALYRFRGATVENLVEFDSRCIHYLKAEPTKISLSQNFRSRKQIVDCYTSFIESYDWRKNSESQPKTKNPYYRVMDKGIFANSDDERNAVLVTNPGKKEKVTEDLVQTIMHLKESGKVKDYNEIAVLFASLKGPDGMASKVKELHDQLEAEGIPVYAPRAKRFLEVEEAVAVFGIFWEIIGQPDDMRSIRVTQKFKDYLKNCHETASKLIKADIYLKSFVEDKKSELKTITNDFVKLEVFCESNGWQKQQPLTLEILNLIARDKNLKLSVQSTKAINNRTFIKQVEKRYKENNPFTISYLLGRICSVDWNLLDIFYQVGAFNFFKKKYQLAEEGKDEGPICNLAQISKYIERFMQQYRSVITADIIENKGLSRSLFVSYLFALFRLQEGEFESVEDPFPKGRISFLTIHQSKGLEFPAVVLGSIYRKESKPSLLELFVREKIRPDGEPLDLMSKFDNARMFYVGLSRAENVLVIPYFKGQGNPKSPGFDLLLDRKGYTNVNEVNWNDIPETHNKVSDISKSYSFTGDYMAYLKCPRHYMAYYKYEFVPSRAATMMFGSLVHQTLEDVQHRVLQTQVDKS